MTLLKNCIWRKYIVHTAICVTLLISIIPGFATVDNNTTDPTTYVSYIDDKIGFFRVIDPSGSIEPSYKDRVLTINQGDTVIWLNDADAATLTVVSGQDLWDKKKSKLGSMSRRFSHTFMTPDTYSVYIEEYDNIVAQEIIVNPIEGYPTPAPTPDVTLEQIVTPTPVPSVTPAPTPIHTIEISSKNITNRSLANISNNTSEKVVDLGLSWNIVIGLINAIANLILSLSVFLIAYKIYSKM